MNAGIMWVFGRVGDVVILVKYPIGNFHTKNPIIRFVYMLDAQKL